LQNPLDELEAEPSLIVIDGLDESATNDRSDIVKLMANHFPELPRSVKVLVTSRSELSIQILHHIQTIKVEADDYQNEWDLSRYIEDSCKSFEMNTTSLILEKCEGSFLYAFHFQHELRKRDDLYTVEDLKNFLPKGLGSVYEMYFHRLEVELEIAMNKKPDLYKILELVVAAKKSLPLSFFARALDLDPGCREMRRIINKVNEAISCLLYISNDVVTVFHKSVYDWLLGNGYNDHEYSVKIDNGSKRLWKMCKQIFEKIKETVISGNDVKSTNEVMYTLKYGHDYLLACDMKDDFHWLVDMIVVHVCTTVVHRQHLKWNWRDALRSDKAMNLSLRKRISWHFIEFYEDTKEGENQSCSYLESVLNHSPEGCFTTEERSIAKVILKKFCQCVNHSNNDNNRSLKPLFANTFSNLSDITAVDVCPRKKLAAVALKDGTIRVLSLPELVELFQYSTGLKHIPCCKFSPDCSVLLYGKLAKALSIDEEKEILYFNGKVDTFQSCSFSPNGKRLVTSDGSKILMLWDVSRKMLVSFLFGALPLTSCSFSETGLFITGNGERHNEDSYCVWSAITFQRMDQRSFYNNNVERKDQRRRSQRCNRCFCQAHKDLIPQKEFSTKEWGNSTGIYKNVECIFHLDGQSLHVVETIHLSTLAIWGIFIEHFKYCISHYVIAAIEYNLWFYSDGCVLVVYLAVPLKESQSCLLPPTRGLWCCFSPDGSRLACFTSDGFINLWYVDTSNIYQRFRVDIGTFSAACWWSENYLFACYLKDEIPFLVQYPANENLTIMVAEMLPISLCPVVNSFLPFSKFLDFSEGYISFECDRRSPVKVMYVNEMDCPKIVCLPEIRPMMRIAVSVGGSLILGAYYSGTLIWKRSEADAAVYDILTAYGYDMPTLYSVGSCCFSDDLKNVVSFLPGEYSMAFINLDSDVFVTKEIRDGDSTDMCRNRVTSENIVQFPKHQWAPAQVFCTKSVLVFVTTKLIRIFDRKSEKFLRSLFHWHLNDCSIIHSKLSPKGTVLAVPRLNGFVDFFQICHPEHS
jgi:WD40 repeat protein